MRIQAIYIGNLFDYATYQGVSEEMLRNYLAEKDLDVCNQNNTVTINEYLNVFDALQKRVKDTNFGIHFGCYLNLKALGFIVQLSLNASSLEQAVFILQTYLQNTFPIVSLESEERNGKYILSLTAKIENEKLKHQVLDFVFCFIYRELKLMLSNDFKPVLEVPGSNPTEFTYFLNAEVKKGIKHRFIYEASVLNAEINKKTVKEIEILLPKFLQMFNKTKPGYNEFSMQVRTMVLNLCCPELPTFKQVAIHFPLSNRTIQRKLTEEGLSFRKITNEIKNELSNYLSKGHQMKTQDIAHLLGYSETSAYLHAVKKWETEFIS
ncbi:AraC family transcriptional regulator ligand-binding domain-containing protein [Arenibacter sp. GZD96]|uniref:AraC family transcriptional regulator ligand-binding domain-containing protein n=1 Tax=Aurantibrevibacter litoralis TaxID=3106030 RepID=UPI002AFEFF7A|nr:AraC family transcriptional regulator ligand-binding domain-containing protein [Arenibacter sp. GZD-96]MEA1785462.1 AraC family transcriptional regulator ligand-binding domain-containing protein [Arenibacter sp. GZD-96]